MRRLLPTDLAVAIHVPDPGRASIDLIALAEDGSSAVISCPIEVAEKLCLRLQAVLADLSALKAEQAISHIAERRRSRRSASRKNRGR